MALKVVCKGKKRDSFVVALTRQLTELGRDSDEAIVRVLRGGGTEADRQVIERAARAADWLAGAT